MGTHPIFESDFDCLTEMPAKITDEEKLPKIPNLDVAQWKFFLKMNPNCEETQKKLKTEIKEKEMAPFYAQMCDELGQKPDDSLLAEMKKKNEEKIAALDKKIAAAEELEGDQDVRDATIDKAHYLAQIGDKEESIKVFGTVFQEDKKVPLGVKLDVTFSLLRIGLFYNDRTLIVENVKKARKMIDDGGDWDRRNRLKVYEGLYKLTIRDFKNAAELFLGAISTFTSYELMDYDKFIKLAVITSMLALPRPTLREKICQGSEIAEVLHDDPSTKQYLFSFYNSQFQKFFRCLAFVEQELKMDRLLNPHYKYYTREMRILAYNQQLKAYNSMSLDYMAQAFGVSTTFIDKELASFITAGRIHAKIDKVNGIIETNRPDEKNRQYQSVIKKGDLLLNRVQKLSRVINI